MSYAETANHAHYVTARHGDRTALLAGPFPTHAAAQAHEEPCRQIIRTVYALDPAATFAEIGTSRATQRPGRRAPAGKLNARLGIR